MSNIENSKDTSALHIPKLTKIVYQYWILAFHPHCFGILRNTWMVKKDSHEGYDEDIKPISQHIRQ